MTIQGLLSLYLSHQLRGKSSERYYARLFAGATFAPLKHFDARAVDKRQLLDWLLQLRDRPGHCNKALGALRAAYRWAISLDLLPGPDPTVGLRRCPDRTRAVMVSPAEWARLVPHLENLRLRHRIYFWALYLLGSRPGEVRSMQPHQLNFDSALWTKPLTKNGRPHVVPLPAELVPLLALTLSANPPNATWLFWGERPDRCWTRTAAQKVWERVRRKASLDHLWLNDLRRSTASDLLNQGESLGIVQGALNHRSLSQTAKYAYLATRPLAEAIQRRTDTIMAALR